MEIAVIGIGAVGTIISARFAQQGQKTYVVCKHEETLKKVQEHGLRVIGVKGRYSVKANIEPVLLIEDLPDNLDAILYVTKTIDLEEAIERSLNKLKKNGTIITTQNGVLEEELSEKYSKYNFLASTISFGATLLGPAYSQQTSSGEIIVGRIDGKTPSTEVDKKIFSLYNKIEPTTWTDNIIGYKYSKLLINSAISSLGAVSGLTLGEMMKRKNTRLAFLRIISEGVEVADRNNINLEKLNRLNFYNLAIPLRGYDPTKFSYGMFKRHLILKLVGKKYQNLKSSMLQSIERGRKTEIEHLNGHLVKRGEQLNSDIRLNKYIVALVKKIENGQSTPSIDNLEVVENKTIEFFNN